LGGVGGMVLHKGEIAEMRTGEGKTLVAILPAYLNALVGKGVHVVTVNDYLARRDCEWVGQVPRFLGMKVGLIQRMSHTSFLLFPICFLDFVSIYFHIFVHPLLFIWVLVVFKPRVLFLCHPSMFFFSSQQKATHKFFSFLGFSVYFLHVVIH
jgi:hypothetical protein